MNVMHQILKEMVGEVVGAEEVVGVDMVDEVVEVVELDSEVWVQEIQAETIHARIKKHKKLTLGTML